MKRLRNVLVIIGLIFVLSSSPTADGVCIAARIIKATDSTHTAACNRRGARSQRSCGSHCEFQQRNCRVARRGQSTSPPAEELGSLNTR